MKILIFTFLLSFCLINVSRAQTIFDPATVNADSLPEGMSIVDIGGAKYCQIILNGWKSSIPVAPVEIAAGQTHMRVPVKYSVGTSGFDIAKINTFVKIANSSNTVEVAVGGAASSAKFMNYYLPIKTPGTVEMLQVAGQETTGWSAVVGDTLWIGKVSVIQKDPEAIFDPYTVDPDALPDGWSIVEIGTQKFAQVILNGWNSSIPVDAFDIPDTKTHMRVVTKYGSGVSGFEPAKINTFLKLTNSDFSEEIAVSGVPSTTTFNAKFVALKTKGIVGNLQVGGQETTGWSAVVGDTLWIGKVKAITEDKTAIVDPATFDPKELSSGWEIVSISGAKYFKVLLSGWGTSLPIDAFTFPKGTTDFKGNIKYEVGTSGFELAKINTFFKLANSVDPTWIEIGASGAASSADFKEYKVAVKDATVKATVLQVAGQETTGWSAVSGDYMYIGKVTAVVPPTPNVTFIVDDSANKTGTGYKLKGSWLTATGEYDSSWNSGDEKTNFYDDGTHGDAVKGDNLWSVILGLVPDAGKNTWEWGFNDLKATWIPTANIQFKIVDTKALTTTYVIPKRVGVETLGNKWSVYPNPATNLINITGADVKNVEIFNIYGAKVLVSNNKTIDISSLKSGSYIVKVSGINGETTVNKLNKK